LYRVIRLDISDLCFLKKGLAYDEWPYSALYNWVGDEIPTQDVIANLDFHKCTIRNNFYGIYPLTMTWIPHIEQLTLVERESGLPMPLDSQIYQGHSSANILRRIHTFDEYFKNLYEQLKN
jgi:hypothetical protein